MPASGRIQLRRRLTAVLHLAVEDHIAPGFRLAQRWERSSSRIAVICQMPISLNILSNIKYIYSLLYMTTEGEYVYDIWYRVEMQCARSKKTPETAHIPTDTLVAWSAEKTTMPEDTYPI